MKLFNKVLPPKKLTLKSGATVYENRSHLIVILPIFILFSILAIKITGFNLNTLFTNANQFFVILAQIFKPNLDYLPQVINPLKDTIKMSFLGSFLGAIVAMPFAFLASTNMVDNKVVNWIIRLLFSVLRTIPTLVNALIATYIFGLGTLAGTIAIFIFSFSYVGKLTYEQIETVDMGAFEAMISMGFTKVMAFIKGVVPQILPIYISTSLYNFEGNVRYAAILGYVGAGGLGLLLNENIGWRDYNSTGTILLCLLVTVFVIENISSYFRNKLN
ncbi:phosphonate transport system permease protein [Anaerosphaera aminiphila DSM 21120]|uniref:Phosphonate transport system permease protein n=1 Tax=Anaerosphaera aminiphila DSM 21120 TaxID=1120995 RepID=A0A1M5UC10_9FIRM|nr:phosphonate ABC transporter, permease protein PhnE [Anaerosphaera aminiphila]SHH60480.1 phosphonate transport system permease protein [Anaerosphaera aminiphila DSM 21120]